MKASISKRIGAVAMAMLLVVVGVTGLILLPKVANANNPPWAEEIGGEDLRDWGHRVLIDVDNNLDDYPTLVIVGFDDDLGAGENRYTNLDGEEVLCDFDCSGDADTDLFDCRFLVYENHGAGTQWYELPFWQDRNGPWYGMFWVKNEYNSTEIWMYYDNYNADIRDCDNHDGSLVFDFFTEGETGQWDDWTWDTYLAESYYKKYSYTSMDDHPFGFNYMYTRTYWEELTHAMQEDIDITLPCVMQVSAKFDYNIGGNDYFAYFGISDENIDSGHDADAIVVGIKTNVGNEYYQLECFDNGDSVHDGTSSLICDNSNFDIWTIVMNTDEVNVYFDDDVPDYNWTNNLLWTVDSYIPDGTMHPYVRTSQMRSGSYTLMAFDYIILRQFTDGAEPTFDFDLGTIEEQD